MILRDGSLSSTQEPLGFGERVIGVSWILILGRNHHPR